jgi:hypothetical protein
MPAKARDALLRAGGRMDADALDRFFDAEFGSRPQSPPPAATIDPPMYGRAVCVKGGASRATLPPLEPPPAAAAPSAATMWQAAIDRYNAGVA